MIFKRLKKLEQRANGDGDWENNLVTRREFDELEEKYYQLTKYLGLTEGLVERKK